jgi:hypothetical protein
MTLNRFSINSIMAAVLIALMITGCGPTPQEAYDEAVRQVSLQQERLDSLRPAYDAARQKALLAVTQELAGATPDQNALNALAQIEGIAATTGNTDLLAGTKQDQLDAAVNHLTTMQAAIEAQQNALLGGAAKVTEVMKQIETPGTPENKRFEVVLDEMPEAQAYRRQENRLEQAAKAVLEAEAKLPK